MDTHTQMHTSDQSQIIEGDAYVDPTQTIRGDTVKLLGDISPPGFGTPGYVFIIVVYIGGHGTLQKYRGTGTRYFAKISTAVPVLSN